MSNRYMFEQDKDENNDIRIPVDLKYHTLVDGLSLGVVYLIKDYKVIDKNHLIDYWFPTGLGENSLCFHSLDLNKRSKPCEDCRILDTFDSGYPSQSIRVKKTSIGDRTFKIVARPIKDENNQVIAVMETLEDITDLLENQKQKAENERRLREYNERFLQLARQSRSVTWEVDVNGLYKYVSDNVEEEWGYKEEDLVYKLYFYDLHPEKERERYKEIGIRTILSGVSITGMENPIVTKSGNIKWLLSAGIPKYDKRGEIIGFKGIDTDISILKDTQHQLISNRRFLSDILEYSGTLIYTKDIDDRYTFVNKKWEEVTGLSREKTLGYNDFEVFPLDVANRYLENDKKVLELKRVIEFEEYLQSEDGIRHFISIKFPIFDEHDEITSICGITTDITDRKIQEERITYLATHDYLTGLPTIQVIKDRIKLAIQLGKRNNSRFSVLFIDLDGFKNVNDTYGHDSGDKVLVEVAKRIEETIRKSDTASRIAGDEFMVLLMEIEDEKGVTNLVNRLKDKINKPILVDKGEVRVGSSIGVAIYPDDGETIDDLVRHSDKMMYLDKRRESE